MASRKRSPSRQKAHIHRYEFPYVRFHEKFYPLIPVTLTHKGYSVNTFALLDSGASVSVFRPEIAKALHFSLKRKGRMKLGTVGGGFHVGLSKVNMDIEQSKFRTRVGFSSHYDLTFNILGREGIFPRFSICFNEMMKMVIMVPLKGLLR